MVSRMKVPFDPSVFLFGTCHHGYPAHSLSLNTETPKAIGTFHSSSDVVGEVTDLERS